MRVPELIVKYESGPQHPSDDIEYVGVFIADRGVDRAFADSEPPAHDAWEPRSVPEPRHRSIVRVALDKIALEARFLAQPVRSGPDISPNVPLGAISDEFSVLIPAAEGTGAGPSRDASAGPPRGPRVRIRPTGVPNFDVVDGQPAVITSFEVLHRPGSAGSRIRATAGVLLDDGSLESALESPENEAVPSLIGWIDPDERLLRVDEVEVPAERVGAWRLVTSAVGDASIGLVIEGQAFEDAKS
jgi:hypothetical protein